MKILVVGSPSWKNYNEIMRQMTLVIEDVTITAPEETRIVFLHTGLRGAENMVTEYLGKVEKFLRQKGYTVKEELFNKKLSGNALDKITGDYDMTRLLFSSLLRINAGHTVSRFLKRSACRPRL